MSEVPLIYRPFKTFEAFHQEWNKYYLRAVKGPFGSGKSVGVVEELLYCAMRQEPVNKIRYTRFGVIRKTYLALRTTTRDTLSTWLPAGMGYINSSIPMVGTYDVPLRDGTTCNMEFYLISVDDEESMEKLRSTNFTYIWINEATEMNENIITVAASRVGRYPSGPYGKCTNEGIIMDYNNPPKGHWIRNLFGPNKPKNYKEYCQPPAAFKLSDEENKGKVNPSYRLNPNADNLQNLPKDYYKDQITSLILRSKYDQIDLLYCLETAAARTGKAVWDSFKSATHVLPKDCDPYLDRSVLIGLDTSGLHPCAIFLQNIEGSWIAQFELLGDGVGFEDYVHGALKPFLLEHYPGCKVLVSGDPANARDSGKGLTPIDVLIAAGIEAQVAQTNKPERRITAVAMLLNMRTGGLLISPRCVNLIEAMEGGYQYAKLPVQGSETQMYSATPVKNVYSHYADALQYAALKIQGATKEDIEREQKNDSIKDALAKRIRALTGR